MSWHTSALVIEGSHLARGPDILADLGLPGRTDVGPISGADVGSSDLEGRAIGVVGGWTLIWDPMMFVPDDLEDLTGMFEDGIWSEPVDLALAHISEKSRVYSFVAEGSSDTNGFAWYVGGSRARLLLSQARELVLDEGAALPEETAAITEEPAEQSRLFLLMEKLTGVSLEASDAATYRLLA